MDRVQLKLDAKSKMNGNYGQSALLYIVQFLISLAVSFILYYFRNSSGIGSGINDETYENIVSIILSLVSMLFAFGTSSFFLKISRGENVKYKEMFSKMYMWLPYFLITLVTGIIVFAFLLLFIIPGIIATIAYSQAYLIKLDNPDMKIFEVLKKSREMMRGHKWEFFVLSLSFIGWYILCALTLGVLFFYVVPYNEVTLCNFYNKIKN